MVTGRGAAWTIAAQVPDPELPAVTLAELGILRDVQADGTSVTVTITPTYSGCPAMPEIRADLRFRLQQAGFDEVTVRTALAPAWSSDWISAEGRRKLAAAGIAPPRMVGVQRGGPIPLTLLRPVCPVDCPHCGSQRTEETSRFGATACRSLHRCRDCGEPFEHVKEL